MATTGIFNGTNLRIFVGGTAVGYSTTCTLDMNIDLRETLTKDSPGSGWRTISPGQKSGTLTGDALYSEDTANVSPIDLFGYFTNKTSITWSFTTDAAGDTGFTGSGYITALNMNAPVEDNVSFSFTIEVDGAITTVTET